jgi:hypothetical protein
MDSLPSPLVAFASGVGVTLVGVLVTTLLQRRRDRRGRIEEGRFRVYMKLMELHSFYFFASSAEVRHQELSSDVRQRIRSLAGELADMLRSADELGEVPQLLRILMSMDYPSAQARYRDMGDVLDALAKTVNPRYSSAARAIGDGNLQDMSAGGAGRTHTPIFMD